MGVQFNDEENGSLLYARFERSNRTPGMVAMLQKAGLAKNETQAIILLIGLVVILVGIMIFSLSTMGSPGLDELPDQNLSV